jgi:tRNA(Ile)-lysidine synthase
LLPGGEIQIGGWRITCRTESSRPGLLEEVQSDADADQRIELLDADAVEGRLVCRPRRPGDRFHPLGATGRQSVSDFLTNRKLSTPMRQRVACLEDEVGIVYVAPLRIDDRVKLRPETRRVLRLEVQNS